MGNPDKNIKQNKLSIYSINHKIKSQLVYIQQPKPRQIHSNIWTSEVYLLYKTTYTYKYTRTRIFSK